MRFARILQNVHRIGLSLVGGCACMHVRGCARARACVGARARACVRDIDRQADLVC